MKSNVVLALAVLLSSPVMVLSQVHDTVVAPNAKLDEIVISGQYNPQSIDKAINNVTILNRQRIENLGAVTLADALNQVMNISILPNAKTGRSSVKMFGLDGQYFTILIDNVPMISDEGFGNNTDLTQINLDDVAQIEIVEGAMGVDYGANAITGIINIITRKSNINNWNANAFVQEESVGTEYNWKNKGKHIQGITLGRNLNDNLYASVSYTHNDFKGWFNDREGQKYYGDDDKRGHEWLPKDQNNVKALLNYHKGSYRVFYKFEYFDERMKDYAKTFDMNEDPVFETINPTAKDRILNTYRLSNVLNTSGKIQDALRFDLSFSYQKQEKNTHIYRYRIMYNEKYDKQTFKNESREVFFSRGMFSEFINWERAKFQVGYEVTQNEGYSSMLEELGEKPTSKSLGSYDFYASSEVSVLENLMLRPGYRVMTSNLFSTQHALSLVAKYVIGNNYEVRATFGSSPRLPNYEELYTYFVDANHDLRGNPDLVPEKGKTFFLNFKKTFDLGNDVEFNTNITARYLNVTDKIEQIQKIEDAGLIFVYENVDRYRNKGITLLNQLSWKNLDFGLGFTMSGTAEEIYNAPAATDRFMYTPEITSNISYKLNKSNTIFSLYYKYNGEEYKYKLVSALTGDYYIKGKQQSYSWMDFTVRQPFMDKRINLTLGVRNLFNVVALNSTALAGDAHSGPESVVQQSYGRSYFVKLQYSLGF